jgi:phospholipase C
LKTSFKEKRVIKPNTISLPALFIGNLALAGLFLFGGNRAQSATGTIADVKHVVIFIQENRSFDHYFGTLHGVHGFNDRNILMLTNGNSDLYQPSGSSYELPFHTTETCLTDLDHSWGPTHNAIDNDRNDGWIAAKGTETMAYYNRSDLAYYYALADSYTVLDDYHCCVRASTDPNRVSIMTGMIDPTGMGATNILGLSFPGGPLTDNTEPTQGWGPGWVTYPELLVRAGISWKVYQEADNFDDNALAWFAVYKLAAPGNPLHDNGMTTVSDVVSAFQSDVTANTLPAVSWIIAPTTESEHPQFSPESGEALTKQFLDALASNPAVHSNTVFILTYDENDGFFDHGLPITPPPGTTNEFVGGLAIGLGVRVPAIIVSPWTRGGHVCSQVFDHTSILRFLETWIGVAEPNMSAWRRQVTGDLTSAFDFAHPLYDYPSLPVTSAITCLFGSTPSVPSPQSVPTQETGTLTPRMLPYEPNAWPVVNAGAGSVSIVMTNSGTASFHFLVVPNAYVTNNPTPYDVVENGSATRIYTTTNTGGKYDLSCYGPDGFERRFVGNVTSNGGQIEVLSSLNPATGAIQLALANATTSPVNFTVVDGYALTTNTVAVPAASTNFVSYSSPTNYFSYDLTATANTDPSFLRRFLGRVEKSATLVAPVLSAIANSGHGTFQIQFSGPQGQSYHLLTSTNLTLPSAQWQTATSGVFVISPQTFTDTNAANQAARFYRVVSP